jgi:hypothetical protein
VIVPYARLSHLGILVRNLDNAGGSGGMFAVLRGPRRLPAGTRVSCFQCHQRSSPIRGKSARLSGAIFPIGLVKFKIRPARRGRYPDPCRPPISAQFARSVVARFYQRDGHPAPSEFAPAGLFFWRLPAPHLRQDGAVDVRFS